MPRSYVSVSYDSYSDQSRSSGSSSHWPELRRNQPFDIVTIHGIVGSAFETWKTPNGLSLPQALLEGVDEEASKIIEFEYDPKAVFGGAESSTGIRDTSLQLLEKIWENRYATEDDETPIAFLGHDLGGVIAKQALLIAKDHDRYRPIALDTSHLALFAVPQRADPEHRHGSLWRTLIEILYAMPKRDGVESALEYINISSLASTIEDISKQFLSMIGCYVSISIYQEPENSGAFTVVSVQSFPLLSLLRFHSFSNSDVAEYYSA